MTRLLFSQLATFVAGQAHTFCMYRIWFNSESEFGCREDGAHVNDRRRRRNRKHRGCLPEGGRRQPLVLTYTSMDLCSDRGSSPSSAHMLGLVIGYSEPLFYLGICWRHLNARQTFHSKNFYGPGRNFSSRWCRHNLYGGLRTRIHMSISVRAL